MTIVAYTTLLGPLVASLLTYFTSYWFTCTVVGIGLLLFSAVLLLYMLKKKSEDSYSSSKLVRL